MSFDLSQFHQTFFEETREHLDEMEQLLLVLDVEDPDATDLDAIFRAAHSIKGGSGMFGFTDMTKITHVLESLLDLVRKHKLPLSSEIIEAALQAGDILRAQLAGHREGIDSDPAEAEPVIAQLEALAAAKNIPHSTKKKTAASAQTNKRSFEISYTPSNQAADTLQALHTEISKLGSVTVSGNPSSALHYTLTAEVNIADIEEIFSFVANQGEYHITQTGGVTEQASPASEEAYGFFDAPDASPTEEILIEEDGFGFFTDPAPIKQSVDEDEAGYGFFTDIPNPNPNNENSKPTPSKTPAAPEAQRRRASDRDADASIRVSVEKVDQLINLIGELVITHAMLAQTVAQFDPVAHEGLFNGMGQLERNSRDLQEAVMSIRMLPIGSVFSRFPRLVRDLAGKLEKQIELKLVGETTELDKGLIERLADPLTHLVRNSIDHGIEMPAIREQNGKPAKGTLTLQAFHQGGSIVVEVIDDGGGLNREKILAKARERNVPVADNPSDQDIWQLIFAPGFSTADQVTDVSGRGVGMDVVKRNIEGMGGRVEINSQEGIGTRITTRLPLTLAILDGMSIGVGIQVFIVPLNMIVESLQPNREQISTVSGKGRVVHVRGEYLPLIALHELFNVPPVTDDPCEGILIILEIEGGKVALFVDELLGQHQVVIKSLETNYRRVRGISGATIMGDGRVALILDVPALVQLSRE